MAKDNEPWGNIPITDNIEPGEWFGFYISHPGFKFKLQDMAEDYGEKRWDELSRLLFMETERKLMFGPGKGILEQVEPRLVKYSVLGKEVTRRYEKNVDTGKTRLISIDWNI